MTTGATQVDRSPFEQLAELTRLQNAALESGKAMVIASRKTLPQGEYSKYVDRFYADMDRLMAFEAKQKK